MARFVWSDFSESALPSKTTPAPEAEELLRRGLAASTGRLADTDMVAAHKWFNLAALKGSQKARRYRMEIAAELSREELREAQRQARAWLNRH